MSIKSNLSIFSRVANDAFEAINICNIIQQHGCDVFSVTYRSDESNRYEIWGKYSSSDQLIDIDLKVSEIRDAMVIY